MSAKVDAVILPPSNLAVTDMRAMQSVATSTAAASTSLWGAMSEVPKTKVWVQFECTGFPAYIRIGLTAAAGTTAANGTLIPIDAGFPRRFYLTPSQHTHVDHLATGVGVLKWHVCSPPGERERI